MTANNLDGDSLLRENLVGLLKSAMCPNNNCDNKGTIVSTRFDDVGELCQWCYERDSAIEDLSVQPAEPKQGRECLANGCGATWYGSGDLPFNCPVCNWPHSKKIAAPHAAEPKQENFCPHCNPCTHDGGVKCREPYGDDGCQPAWDRMTGAAEPKQQQTTNLGVGSSSSVVEPEQVERYGFADDEVTWGPMPYGAFVSAHDYEIVAAERDRAVEALREIANMAPFFMGLGDAQAVAREFLASLPSGIQGKCS